MNQILKVKIPLEYSKNLWENSLMKDKSGTGIDCAGLLKRTGQGGNPTQFERECEDLVTRWVGNERAPDVLGAMRRPMRNMEELVDQCLKKLNCGDMVTFSKVKDNWIQIVNSPMAARMLNPVSVRNHVLLVESANPSFQMAYRDPRIMTLLIERLKTFSDGEVTDVKFTAQGRFGKR